MLRKLTQIDRKRDIIILAVVAAVMVSGGNATADFVLGEPTNLGPPVNTSYGEGAPCISADGLSLYFASNGDGGYGSWDLWMTTRETTDDEWGPRTNLGPTVNTSSGETAPRIAADGLSLYLASTRDGGYGSWDLWITTRETTSDPWGRPVNLGPAVNSPAGEISPSISADGLELYFAEWQVARPGGYGESDLWVTNRPTKDDPWGTPVNLGDTVNGGDYDGEPFISADGLKLCFSSTRAGGSGSSDSTDIWLTTRASTDSLWAKPVNLGPTINSPLNDDYPSLSTDGSALYFNSDRSGGSGDWDLWEASVIPIVDFNSDGALDCIDVSEMIDFWGTDNTLYDIGPMPWGDGVVDAQDLLVLAEYMVDNPTDVNDVNDL